MKWEELKLELAKGKRMFGVRIDPALAKERTFKPFIARVRQVVSDGAPLFFYGVDE